MQYHEVKINIEFDSKDNCCTDGLLVDELLSASLWVDYIFLDTDERRRFASLSHEYLIEQLQFTGDESISSTNNRIKLSLNHPCKELVWVVQPDDLLTHAGGMDWTNFAVAGPVDPVVTAKLQLNGHDRMAERFGDYYSLVQPFQHHENVPSTVGIHVYSFALKPEEHQPSGTLNMSRIDNATLSMTTDAAITPAAPAKVKVYAVSYNVLRIKHSAEKLHAIVKRHSHWENVLTPSLVVCS